LLRCPMVWIVWRSKKLPADDVSKQCSFSDESSPWGYVVGTV
jgi:hypothetical protein